MPASLLLALIHMFTQSAILDIGKSNPIFHSRVQRINVMVSHKYIFRLELQNRLPWLAINEKPISDTASNATDATQNHTTTA